MKSILLSLFISFTVSLFGQNYLPLNTPKRFQNSLSTLDNDYYFYPIDTLTNGDTTTYLQYLKVGAFTSTVSVPMTTPLVCSVWGDPTMVQAADTTWLGRYVHFETISNELIVQNKIGENLAFDFGLSLGDSAVFYQNASEEYYLKYTGINEEVIYGVTDSLKTFVIQKFDLAGSALSSTLNNFEVKIGKDLGLVSLIDCNNFPSIEVGLELMGQLYPTIGEYNMTYDEAFPWTPGDSLEVKGTQPFLTTYKLITITDRVETTDSVWIHLNFEGDLTGYNIEYPDVVTYRKGQNVSVLPNDSWSESFQIYNDLSTMCGTRKRYHRSSTTKYYCDSFNCFPDFDAFGALLNTDTYLAALGKTYQKSEYWGSSDMVTGELIYSSVGGVVCGTSVALGLNENGLQMSISPNPARNEINVKASFEIDRVELVNSAGIVQLRTDSNGFSNQLDISKLKKGIYFVVVHESNGHKVSSKFIKQ